MAMGQMAKTLGDHGRWRSGRFFLLPNRGLLGTRYTFDPVATAEHAFLSDVVFLESSGPLWRSAEGFLLVKIARVSGMKPRNHKDF